MATITPGVNASITSSILEMHLLETFLTLEIYESNPNHNPNRKNCLSAAYNIGSGLFDATFNLACDQYISGVGETTINIPNYLTGISFTPGNPTGTFKSATLPAYFIEVILYCDEVEKAVPNNATDANSRVTIAYDAEAQQISGTIKLPCTVHADLLRGRGVFSPLQYLV